jgi:hypothetical protein
VPTIVRKKKYEKLSEGLHHCRLFKFNNLGVIPYMGEERPRGNFDWIALDENDSQGNPVHVFESFNPTTIEPKSTLLKILTQMHVDTDGDVVLEDLEGTECDLEIMHNASDGKVYANIVQHLPHTPRKETKASGMNARTVVRSQPQEDAVAISDDDIPF